MVILRRRKFPPAPHMVSLNNNFKEIERLIEIHTEISGDGPGYKHNVQVLNKSAIMLLLACWEAYIEDLAKNTFEVMLRKASIPTVFPEHVLAIAAKEIKNGDTLTLWSLAGDGWKSALASHKEKVFNKYIERNAFNTPSAERIDKLFTELIGLTSMSGHWQWVNMSSTTSKTKLSDLIELRGCIAHRVEASQKVTKTMVVTYKEFITRLAVICHNRALAFINAKTSVKPWKRYRYGNTK